MVEFALEECAKNKKTRLVALTTQTSAFFRDTCGFSTGQRAILPKELRTILERSDRNSQIFYKDL
jgi:N-acetylglutamate synthase-like GNAT family acetyltransferase